MFFSLFTFSRIGFGTLLAHCLLKTAPGLRGKCKSDCIFSTSNLDFTCSLPFENCVRFKREE